MLVGLSGFEVDDEVFVEVQCLVCLFVYKLCRQEFVQQLIYGLFLMGSLGSLVQEEQSDFDFWVCYVLELEFGVCQELCCKCVLIEDWVCSQGSEVYCFLIDVVCFGQDECKDWKEFGGDGNIQYFLLFDEFYCSVIWFGGCIFLWWLVLLVYEWCYDEYCWILFGKCFICVEEVFDFGYLVYIFVWEFIGVGFWQLFKVIDLFYKLLFKLLFIEVYVSEYLWVCCVVLCFKEQVFVGQFDFDELDFYVLVYCYFECYLWEQQVLECLEFVWCCLYFKVGCKFGGCQCQVQKGWQYLLMEWFVVEW